MIVSLPGPDHRAVRFLVLDDTVPATTTPQRKAAMIQTGAQNSCLADFMDAHGMRDSTDLLPHLADRGVHLSEPQVRRLVAQRPMLVSLKVLTALCDIFGCSPVDFAAPPVRGDSCANPLLQEANVVDINNILDIRRSMADS